MERVIHTRIVIDAAGNVLEDEFYLYDGPVVECGGGGGKGGGGGSSSTTVTVDYGYNSRMATLSEEQQSWAREYFNMWRDYYKPYEIAQAQANMEALPLETNLYKKQLTAATNLLPAQQAAAQKFLTASADGVDVNERMALAQADVANSWANQQAATERAAARMGVNPNSGRFQGMQAAQDISKAAQMAGARTQARVGAEQENFDRLTKAAQYNATGGILQGINLMRS